MTRSATRAVTAAGERIEVERRELGDHHSGARPVGEIVPERREGERREDGELPCRRPCHGGASCHAEPGLRPLPMLWASQ